MLALFVFAVSGGCDVCVVVFGVLLCLMCFWNVFVCCCLCCLLLYVCLFVLCLLLCFVVFDVFCWC